MINTDMFDIDTKPIKIVVLKPRVPSPLKSFYYVNNRPNFRVIADSEVDGTTWRTVVIYNSKVHAWLEDQDPSAWAEVTESSHAGLFRVADVRDDLYTLLTLTWQ